MNKELERVINYNYTQFGQEFGDLIVDLRNERDKYKIVLDKIKEKCLSIKGNPEHTIVSNNELVKQILELLEEIE